MDDTKSTSIISLLDNKKMIFNCTPGGSKTLLEEATDVFLGNLEREEERGRGTEEGEEKAKYDNDSNGEDDDEEE